MLCLVAAALVACSQETDEPGVVQPTPEAPVITLVTEVPPSGTPIRTHVNSEASKATKSYTPTPRQSGTDPFLGTVSKEELILASDTIVRASLLSATSTAATSTEPDWPGWKAVLEFRFQVHEYLKGTGPDKITAIVTESFTYNSEAEAQDLAPELLAAHDSRWDNRQAILFLSAETDDINGFSSGRLWLGYLDLPIWADSDPDDRYSLHISGESYGSLLPQSQAAPLVDSAHRTTTSCSCWTFRRRERLPGQLDLRPAPLRRSA